MILKFTFLVAVCVFTRSNCPTQTVDSVKPSTFAGYYLFQGGSTQPFPDFVQITVMPDDSITRANKTIGFIVFFSDSTIVQSETDVWCPFVKWNVTADSFKFSTGDCSHERYDFAGHWLLPFSQFEQDGDPAVLEGVLSRYVFGQLKESKKVSFCYSPGC